MENLTYLLTNYPWTIFLLWLLSLLLMWWAARRATIRWKTQSFELSDRINFLEGELNACRKSKVSTGATSLADSGNVTTNVGNLGNTPPVVNKKDDLKIVEGIGPKIEDLFNKAGIYTFAQLAETSVVDMKDILDTAGSRFQIHDPTTWADQAAMARDGKWDELKKWQDELFKGKL